MALLGRYPNLFFLHPSPSVYFPPGIFSADRQEGTLYRTVPMPHSLSESNKMDLPSLRVPYDQRTIHKVAWRGSTTGEYQRPYSRTDRYRMVAAFVGAAMGDVAYSGLCQGIKKHILPAYGQKLSRAEIMHHRATLDVDGNSNSWEGLRWKLLAGAAVVKVRSGLGFVQWYYHHMRSGEELIETDVEHVVDAAMRVVNNGTLGAHLAARALAFAERHLTQAAVDAAVWDLVGNVWRYGYDFGMDWRIRH
jgi:hypothetical protein